MYLCFDVDPFFRDCVFWQTILLILLLWHRIIIAREAYFAEQIVVIRRGIAFESLFISTFNIPLLNLIAFF